jgi:hypothetical protein
MMVVSAAAGEAASPAPAAINPAASSKDFNPMIRRTDGPIPLRNDMQLPPCDMAR